MKYFLPLLFLASLSCSGQKSTTLTFMNRSSNDIDSIVIQAPVRIVLGKLVPGQQYAKTLSVRIDTHNEGIFPFLVHQNGKVISGVWGFHDFGMLSSANEVFYIFENGISSTDAPIPKPKEFTIYFYNASSRALDSFINSNNAIRKIIERTPRSFEIVYDYNEIEKLKKFAIAIDSKQKNSTIDHDFTNWNYNQTFFYFENDSLKKGTLPWKEPLEFIVDLEVTLPFPSDSLKAESDAIVKTYFFKQPNNIKIVFDFRKLRQNPVFTIISPDKKYTIDLSSHDFSNIYSHQKIFYLEKDGIRSLID